MNACTYVSRSNHTEDAPCGHLAVGLLVIGGLELPRCTVHQPSLADLVSLRDQLGVVCAWGDHRDALSHVA